MSETSDDENATTKPGSTPKEDMCVSPQMMSVYQKSMSLPDLCIYEGTVENTHIPYDDTFYYYINSFIDQVIFKYLQNNKKTEFRKRIMSTDL